MTRAEEKRLVAALRKKAKEYRLRALGAWNPHAVDALSGRADALRIDAVMIVGELAAEGRRG
jgi:hypothetical protein